MALCAQKWRPSRRSGCAEGCARRAAVGGVGGGEGVVARAWREAELQRKGRCLFCLYIKNPTNATDTASAAARAPQQCRTAVLVAVLSFLAARRLVPLPPLRRPAA